MSQLVVTIHKDGAIETLLKDNVIDTRKFADARKIERVSEILPSNDGTYFIVRWLKGPLVGTRERIMPDGNILYSLASISTDHDGHPLTFDTYEAGVEFEVATVNAFRLAGHSFA